VINLYPGVRSTRLIKRNSTNAEQESVVTAARGCWGTSTAPRVLACPCPRCGAPHDRHRGVRTPLQAEVATDPERVQHLMSQTSSSTAAFPFRCAGSTLARPFSTRSRPSIHPPPVGTLQTLAETLFSLSCLRLCRHAGRAPLSRSPSNSALTPNRHGAHRPASAWPAATSCLDAFRTPAG
jgi:hypothetical protein